MTRRPRGFVLVTVITIMGILGAMTMALFTQLQFAHIKARDDTRRAQLKWLARSAAYRGESRTWTVPIQGETATVDAAVGGGSVVVSVTRAGRRVQVLASQDGFGGFSAWVEKP